MKFYGTSEFLHSGYRASKIHPGRKYQFWSKIGQGSQKSGFHCYIFLPHRSHVGYKMVILFLLNRNAGHCLLILTSIIKLKNYLSLDKGVLLIHWERDV